METIRWFDDPSRRMPEAPLARHRLRHHASVGED